MTVSKKLIIPVVLSGGIGSRLWPASRSDYPKPFIKLEDGLSFIQKTYKRVTNLSNVKEIITVTNRDLFFCTKDHYDSLNINSINNTYILEPFGRNSAAAVALAASYVHNKYKEDCMLLIFPADHLINNQEAFEMAIDRAVNLADGNDIITFGIKPKRPETAYGYIESEGINVKRFIEKPSKEKAEHYIHSGNYLWNSGIFCMKLSTVISEMQEFCPQIWNLCNQAIKESNTSLGKNWQQVEINSNLFSLVEDISIDYAVLEKSKNIAVVPCDFEWSDIGSWLEYGALNPKDSSNNHLSGDVILDDVDNCIIDSRHKLIAALGLSNIVIAETEDAVLVMDKNNTQGVKKLVKKLKDKSHKAYKKSSIIQKRWGNYRVLESGEGFKVKRLEINPGASLSLQSHNHRSEHWTVMQGFAKVIKGNQTLSLKPKDSIFIPENYIHCIENIGNELLVILETQFGDYLEEDDIIRYSKFN